MSRKCKECNSPIVSTDTRTLFCSRKCSAVFNNRVRKETGWKRTDSSKLKVSATMKRLGIKPPIVTRSKDPLSWETSACKKCGNKFEHYKKEVKQYCSIKCWNSLSGGYREGAGRSKHGYYKGIYCGSTYELVWVIYNLDKEIPFKRFNGALVCKNTGRKYFPDFILPNGDIVEIKGYEDESVSIKTAIANSHGYTVLLLKREELQPCFQHVAENYKYKNIEELFDSYIPKYSYTCSFCSSSFSGNEKRNTELVYCSRSCAGKDRLKKLHTAPSSMD